MQIGVPREIAAGESRVGLAPGGVRALREDGHQVLIQSGAGAASGIDDAAFEEAGAVVVSDAPAVFRRADLIVKVTPPLEAEIRLLRKGQVLFSYLHLAPAPRLTQALVETGATGIAYETIADDEGHLPLLAPMSELAGRLAIEAGARCVQRSRGGYGAPSEGAPVATPGEVVVLGGGTVGTHAAGTALALGARVTVLDQSHTRLRLLDDLYQGRVTTVPCTGAGVAAVARRADLLVGSILVTGARTPCLVTRAILGLMKKGAVIVDVAVDQGGCVETTRPTTHSDPTYVVDGVVHYAVPNMPAALPRTSTVALTNATLAYVLKLAGRGFPDAAAEDAALRRGVNIHNGKVTCEAVASSQDRVWTPFEQAL